MRLQKQIKAFHKKFGHLAPDQVTAISFKEAEFRMRLIYEEYMELAQAYEDGVLGNIAHESADLMIVVLGGLVSMGIDAQPILDEVMRANMDKVPAGARVKPVKPLGWRKAAIADEVDRQMMKPMRLSRADWIGGGIAATVVLGTVAALIYICVT